MSQPASLSLVSAILININIMLGSGIFINTVILANKTGALSPLVYAVGALLILPLILTFSHLLSYFPGGTFYDFGAAIHPFIGFVNGWSYFIGKLATPAIGIHIFVTLMQKLFPVISDYNPLIFDTCIVVSFVTLNMFNLKTGRNINYFFIILKLIPILFVFFSAFLLFNPDNFTLESLQWSGLPSSIALAIFAFAGFEATCSLSKSIENPEKNGPRAVLISYLITLIVLMCYQFGFFSILGAKLGCLRDYKEAFPELIQLCIPGSATLQWIFKALTLSGMAASSLGSSYGVIYSNFWNLHALAKNNHIIAAPLFLHKNKYGTPIACVIASGCIIFAYQWLSGGVQIPLQQIAIAGNLMAYTISTLVFMILCIRLQRHRKLAFLSVGSCLILVMFVIINAYTFGPYALFFFLGLILAGICMFLLTKK